MSGSNITGYIHQRILEDVMPESYSEKSARFKEALSLFLERLSQDRYVLAAVLVGSLNEDIIWKKEQLHLWVIEADGVTKRLKSDGNDERIFRLLVEDDINLNCELIPRSRFKMMVEGASRTAFSCNFFAKRELVFCNDASIKKWFAQANQTATKDQEKERLANSCWTIHAARHCRNLLNAGKDLQRARECLIWCAHGLAALEIINAGQVYESYWLEKAIELNPELFQVIYLDMISGKPTKKKISMALETVEQVIDERSSINLKPIIYYLKKQKRLVPVSEISEHFAYSQIYPWHIDAACEWLTDNGYVEKLSTPFKLTKKSRVDVEEPAYLFAD